jgi:SprT protein
MDRIKAVLVKYLPLDAVEKIAELIVFYKIHLTITKNRNTKAGDYRSPRAPKYIQRISVNHDLNKYAFLITLIHEIAHLKVWNSYKHSVQPHGREWKNEYKILMIEFINNKVFTPELELVLLNNIQNPSAANGSDVLLFKTLLKHDNNESGKLLLEDLPEKSVFTISDGRKFIKGGKLRKRYRCTCVNNKKHYLINGIMEVLQETNT